MPTDDLTYGAYLHVDVLLATQQPLSVPPRHDEMLFIVVHQAYELWFRLMIHEIEALREQLFANRLLSALKSLKRLHAVQRVIEQHVTVLETMGPQEFIAFRDALGTSSGFQSAQFRELEFLCGAQKASLIETTVPTPAERLRLERRLNEPTLYDGVKAAIAGGGFDVSSHDALIAALTTIYERSADYEALSLLLEDCIEFDAQLLQWRGRHLRMVERMVGMKSTTQSTLGTRYLETTMAKRFFPALWEVRTVLGVEAR